MLDVDHFKNINDSYGHTIGDVVLAAIAQRCLANIRNIDIIGRYGGEEFALILPETDFSAAQKAAERLRLVVADEPILTEAGPVKMTVSLGVAEKSELITNVEGLLKGADEALLRAKRAGRNRVAI
jgi:diguanylate cyclase (GGDEF)-like protein